MWEHWGNVQGNAGLVDNGMMEDVQGSTALTNLSRGILDLYLGSVQGERWTRKE